MRRLRRLLPQRQSESASLVQLLRLLPQDMIMRKCLIQAPCLFVMSFFAVHQTECVNRLW